MVVTVLATVATGSLAVGVALGVLTAMVAFVRRVTHFTTVDVHHDADDSDVKTYRVGGELFFASSNDLIARFDYTRDPDDVVIDLSATDIWDATSVAVLDTIRSTYESRGKTVRFTGVQGASLDRLNRLSGRLGI
jgi:SulP family sulfate permease